VASFYQPFLLIMNLLYMITRTRLYGFNSVQVSIFWDFLAIVSYLILQFWAYTGILDYATNHPPTKNDTKLVGGVWLDLLGVIFIIQFGAIIVTPKLNWLLLMIPPAAIYTIYQTFRTTNAKK
jgi:hypothetical protein